MGQDSCRSWRGREARVAIYHGKIHGGKSILGVHVARGEFGEITRGEITRFTVNQVGFEMQRWLTLQL